MTLLLALILIAMAFSTVVFFGAPYLPTMRRQSEAALDLLDLKSGQTLIELGSGDGRVLKLAAKRGINAVGYELNPLLALFSAIYTWKYRRKVRIIWGNYFAKKWPEADGVFVFSIKKYMKKLDKKISQYPYRPLKVASFAFKIPGKKYEAEKAGVFLYLYK